MGTFPPDELLKMWQREDLTVDQAAGHIVQNLVHLQARLEQFKDSLLKVRQDVDSLIAHTGLPPRQG